jgi:hypothetical protein
MLEVALLSSSHQTSVFLPHSAPDRWLFVMLCPCIHKVFGSEFATDIAFDALWTLDLWHWDLWKSLYKYIYPLVN